MNKSETFFKILNVPTFNLPPQLREKSVHFIDRVIWKSYRKATVALH